MSAQPFAKQNDQGAWIADTAQARAAIAALQPGDKLGGEQVQQRLTATWGSAPNASGLYDDLMRKVGERCGLAPLNDNAPATVAPDTNTATRDEGADTTPAPQRKPRQKPATPKPQDDGLLPDPTYSPATLAALERYNAEARKGLIGSQSRVLVESKLKGHPPRQVSPHAFIDIRSHERVLIPGDNGPQPAQLAKVWLYDWTRANRFESIEFEPPHSHKLPLHESQHNIWRGFPCDGVPGDWSLLRDEIIYKVLCESDPALFAWWMTWASHIWQRPGQLPGSCIIHWGQERGTGKTLPFEWIRLALGPLAFSAPNKKQLTGAFNAMSAGKLFVQADEVVTGSEAEAGELKNTITNSESVLEGKGLDGVAMSNYRRIGATSNEAKAAPIADAGERRFFMLHAGTQHMQDIPFFATVDAQMRSGGMLAMVHEFQTWDPAAHGLTWNHLRTPPQTETLRRHARAQIDRGNEFAFDLVAGEECGGLDPEGRKVCIQLNDKKETVIPGALMSDAFKAYATAQGGVGVSWRSGQASKVTDMCERYLLGKSTRRTPDVCAQWRGNVYGTMAEHPPTDRPRCWVIPSRVDLLAHHARQGWASGGDDGE